MGYSLKIILDPCDWRIPYYYDVSHTCCNIPHFWVLLHSFHLLPHLHTAGWLSAQLCGIYKPKQNNYIVMPLANKIKLYLQNTCRSVSPTTLYEQIVRKSTCSPTSPWPRCVTSHGFCLTEEVCTEDRGMVLSNKCVFLALSVHPKPTF